MTTRVPITTYRFQFNPGFGFANARALVPYLQKLGITDLYASPLFQARQGSSHGYDVTNPLRLNPELGTEAEFAGLIQDLRHQGMGLLLDIVPNHMAVSPENPWWLDVLENGRSSPYAAYFDIDWQPAKGTLENKVLLPILGGPYGSVLENQELVLALDENGFFVRYYEHKLPLDPKGYRTILAHRSYSLKQALQAGQPVFQELVRLMDLIKGLPVRTATDPGKVQERQQDKETIKHRLWRLYSAHPEIKKFINKNLRIFNGSKKNPASFNLLDQLLADQTYRLSFWRAASERINYRRFFDINGLISVRVEDPQVFEATHALTLQLIKEGKVTGLRIDHIDGLYDPVEYLQRLQSHIVSPAAEQRNSANFYVVVEKILIGNEALPEEWPVCGTTGYDFLTTLSGVFVDSPGLQLLEAIYTQFIGSKVTFADIGYQRKKQVMAELFVSEVGTLGSHLGLLAEQDRRTRDLTLQELGQALVEVTACLPVYRTYLQGFAVPGQDRPYIERAVAEAKRRNPTLDAFGFDFLRRVLLLDFPVSLPAAQRADWLRLVRRWQQFTGPIMAKGLEDTALYVYSRLISLNDVGSDPGAEGLSVAEFHRRNQDRGRLWPVTLNATSTHDTKRSEDVRARINVLSELSTEWARCLSRWSRQNRKKKQRVDGHPVPDPNEEIFLYQTLVGAWPLAQKEMPAFKERLKAYLVKAAREAKVHTSWLRPNEAHESGLASFVGTLLRASSTNGFLRGFLPLARTVAHYGAMNALAQVLLKIASPGVPDFYQGTELWDLSLVDPDNRRPVDFVKRARLFKELQQQEPQDPVTLVQELLAHWQDGRIKLFLTYRALDFRRTYSELFLRGDYIPLYAAGRRKEHICAFARRKDRTWVVVAVPRLLTKLVSTGEFPLGQKVWGRSRLLLPQEAPEGWLNVLTGETLRVSSVAGKKALPLQNVFQHFPLALLTGTST